jgi:alkanesulfonate monooxygenase SsuD/methylene tetrahydromethanopterin reductase-like flavin-dependent oxidoreductase (luciferase family)
MADHGLGYKRELTARKVIVMAAPQVGIFLPSMSDPAHQPGDMAATARHAEDLELESAWVVDQLIAGTGVPVLDSGIALAAAASATTRIRLGYGVIIVPLRPVAWIAKQVASLQHVSGDRIILGVGAGGDRHDRSWSAVGVPRRERGRRTDAALRVLPDLISGKPTRLDDQPDSPTIQLSPTAAVPPILVGGMSDAAMVRAVTRADGWFLLPIAPAEVARARQHVAGLADAEGRPTPAITASMLAVIEGDPSLPDHDALVRTLTDVDGMYGIPADQVGAFLVRGGPTEIAARLAAYGDSGAERVVVTIAGGDWRRQAELLADARARLD